MGVGRWEMGDGSGEWGVGREKEKEKEKEKVVSGEFRLLLFYELEPTSTQSSLYQLI